MRRSTAALCVVLGIVMVIVCGFAAIVERDPAGYVGAVLSAILSFGLAAYMHVRDHHHRRRTSDNRTVSGIASGFSGGTRLCRQSVVHIGMGSGIGYRMTGPGMRVISPHPATGPLSSPRRPRNLGGDRPKGRADRTCPAASRPAVSVAGGPVKNGVRLSWIIDVSSVFRTR